MIRFNKNNIETPKWATLNVAVSMGKDSVALSHFLCSGYRKLKLIHVNHGTPYSQEAETAFIEYVHYLNTERRWRREAGEEVTLIEYAVMRYSNKVKLKSESDFRNVRYKLFSTALEDTRDEEIVVCHHLDDCVESYLMNCLNGHADFMPIPTRTNRGNYTVIRPFVADTERSDINNYVRDKCLNDHIVEDPSNEDITIRRNWLRCVIIPQIRQQYPGINTIVRKKLKVAN